MKIQASAVRIRRTLFLAQSVFSAGYLAAVTVASIVGAALAESAAWAGVPAAGLLLGVAASASMWGAAMDRFGRRPALLGGALLGVAGAFLAGLAVVLRSLPLYIAGMVALGASKASSDLGRYVAGEVHPPSYRARAISTVVMGATVGAVVGPLLAGPMGELALGIGLQELAGPYGATALLLGSTAAVLAIGLRPEPAELAREVASRHPEEEVGSVGEGSVWTPLTRPTAQVAMVTLILAQVVMVMVMVITSLHMRNQGHGLGAISLVISSHTFGMYAFSVISGQLADRWGRAPVIVCGGLLLSASSALAGISPEVLPLGVSLFGLGLGWNFCYVGGSTLLADSLRAAERARIQGVTDTLVGLASAIGSLGSGVVFAALGYGAMGLVGAVIALVPIGATLWWERRPTAVSA